jgi:hypothetical protein
VIAIALSRCYTMLSQPDCYNFGLKLIIEQYELDGDFEDVFVKCKEVSS